MHARPAIPAAGASNGTDRDRTSRGRERGADHADPVEGAGFLTSITLSPDGSRAYVLGTDGIAVLDIGRRAVVATIPAPGSTSFRSVAVAPDGTRAYVPTGDGIAVVDTAANAVVSEIPLPIGAGGGLAISPDGSRLYDASGLSGTVTVIDARSGNVLDVVEIDRYQSDMRIALSRPLPWRPGRDSGRRVAAGRGIRGGRRALVGGRHPNARGAGHARPRAPDRRHRLRSRRRHRLCDRLPMRSTTATASR